MSVPLFLAMYSPPGRGKTLANCRAFPNGLFIAPRGALTCASWLGIMPQSIEATGIRSIPRIIEKYGNQFPALIFSDLSIEADNEAKLLRKQYTGWTVWDKYGDILLEARDAARNAGCHVVWEFHESPPRELTRHGVTSIAPGSFSLSGFKATEKLPGMMDAVMRIVYDDTILGAGNWPYVFSVEPDPMYVTKDRTNAFPRRFH